MIFVRSIFAISALLATSTAIAQQQQTAPSNYDIRVSAALRNDLAGTLIKMQGFAACDVACHIVIARALVALDSGAPVAEPEKDKPAAPPP